MDPCPSGRVIPVRLDDSAIPDLDLGGGRTWFQIPSCEGGSSWFTNKRGTESVPGLVSVELTPGQSPLWRGLVLHA